jgi:ABC-type nitrate/sulfonate/bicarbonate transport system ATPase subunit
MVPTGGSARGGVHLFARDVTLGYGAPASGGRPVVEGVQLSLAPGERVALVGASGSGKTTLLHALAGLLPPVSGEVLVDGIAVASPDGRCSSRHAAYMFQRDLLLPWKSALANATLPAEIGWPRRSRRAPAQDREDIRRRAAQLLVEFGLGAFLDAYPHQISGGMRQRVALARTLLLDRGLILLDEPFAGLDSLTRADLQEWLGAVMHHHLATWVLVTHDVHEAALLADRVAVLGGRPARIIGWVDTAPCAGGADDPAAAGGPCAGPSGPEAELRRMLAKAREEDQKLLMGPYAPLTTLA